MSRIAFPDVRTLSELFTECIPAETGSEAPIVATFPAWEDWGLQRRRKVCYLSGRLWGRGPDRYHSFDVKPTDRVLEHVREHMLHGSNDTIRFEFTWRKDTVLIVAEYSQILGNSWLAELPHAAFAAILQEGGRS